MELDFASLIHPADSTLRAVHLVVLPGGSGRKPLKLLDIDARQFSAESITGVITVVINYGSYQRSKE